MHRLQHKSGGARNLTVLRYAIAASFVLLLGLAAVFYFQASNTRKVIQYVANAEMINKPVKLPDGSTVYLNRNTNLTVDKNFNENTRTVTLSGEAFFDVAKIRISRS
ncbi:MAG: hypothetical protein HC830_12505 [Bacteroidetes bacterium]|nr:hypothetical protein [Bacteroidota bacterium]